MARATISKKIPIPSNALFVTACLFLLTLGLFAIPVSSGSNCMGYSCATTVYTTIGNAVSLEANYTVKFTESGLPANIGWTTTLNGQIQSSNSNVITFQEPAGTYSYSIGTVGGYTSNIKSGNVIVGDGIGVRLVKTFSVSPAEPSGIAYDPKTGYIYVADSYSGNVTVISGDQVVSTVRVAPPFAFQGYATYPVLNMIACDPSNGLAYITAYNATKVYVMNGTSLYGTVPLSSVSNVSAIGSGSTYGIAYNPVYGYIYVARPFANLVSVIKGLKVIGNVSVSLPEQIAVNPAIGYVYVTSGNMPKLFIMNVTNVIESISVTNSSSGLGAVAYDSLNSFVYVASFSNQQVAYLNSTSIVGVLNTASDTSSIAFNPSNNLMYMTTDYPQGSVLVSNGTQVLFTLHDSPGTSGIAYNPRNQLTYVTNQATGNVSILAAGGQAEINVLFQPSPAIISTSTSFTDNVYATSTSPSISNYTIAGVVVVAVVSIAIASSYFLRRKP